MTTSDELTLELNKVDRSDADELIRDWWCPRIRKVIADLARVTAERDQARNDWAQLNAQYGGVVGQTEAQIEEAFRAGWGSCDNGWDEDASWERYQSERGVESRRGVSNPDDLARVTAERDQFKAAWIASSDRAIEAIDTLGQERIQRKAAEAGRDALANEVKFLQIERSTVPARVAETIMDREAMRDHLARVTAERNDMMRRWNELREWCAKEVLAPTGLSDRPSSRGYIRGSRIRAKFNELEA